MNIVADMIRTLMLGVAGSIFGLWVLALLLWLAIRRHRDLAVGTGAESSAPRSVRPRGGARSANRFGDPE